MSTWGRRELLVRHGELMFRRGFAMWTTERAFRNARLEVMHETDSDNDSHYKLLVTDATGPQTVHSQVHDSGEVVDLAHWLACRTGFRLTSAEKLHTLPYSVRIGCYPLWELGRTGSLKIGLW